MSLDAHDLDEPWYTPADEEENQALEGWEKKFQEKSESRPNIDFATKLTVLPSGILSWDHCDNTRWSTAFASKC